MDFEIQTHHLILTSRPSVIIEQKSKKGKITCHQVDYFVPVNDGEKIKENKWRLSDN